MRYHDKFITSNYCATHNHAGSLSSHSKGIAGRFAARVDDLTSCRALFAGWVFAYHLRLPLGPGSFGALDGPVARGYLGVDAFFLLSGLILAHANPAMPPGAGAACRFWVRRLLRIYPVHLAMTALLLVVVAGGALLGLPPRDPGRFASGELARHLLLVHGWGFSGRWAWNYPSWSISTEWAGYLAFPVLWLALRRASPAVCASVALSMLGLLAALDASGGPVGLNLSVQGGLARFFPEFVAGMAAARLAVFLEPRVSGFVVAGAGAAVAGAAVFAWRDWLVVGGVWLALGGLLIAALQERPPVLSRIPLLRVLGEVSFAFYMSFALVETVLAFAWRRAGVAPADREAVFILLSTALTLGVALAVRALVERPALRLGRSLAVRAPAG